MNLKLQRGPQGGVILVGRYTRSIRRRLRLIEDGKRPEVEMRRPLLRGVKRIYRVAGLKEHGRTPHGVKEMTRRRRANKIARQARQAQRAARMRAKHQRQSRRRRAA